MGKIVYLMGKSSSGKDTIFKRLLADGTLDLKTVVPYTTRPIRSGERNGTEYFFTDEDGFLKLKAEGRIIEERTYQTFHGLWRYFTLDDGQFRGRAGLHYDRDLGSLLEGEGLFWRGQIASCYDRIR